MIADFLSVLGLIGLFGIRVYVLTHSPEKRNFGKSRDPFDYSGGYSRFDKEPRR